MYYVDLSQIPDNSITSDVPVSVRDALVFLELAVFPSGNIVPCKYISVCHFPPPPPFNYFLIYYVKEM